MKDLVTYLKEDRLANVPEIFTEEELRYIENELMKTLKHFEKVSIEQKKYDYIRGGYCVVRIYIEYVNDKHIRMNDRNRITQNRLQFWFKIEGSSCEYEMGGHMWLSPYDKEGKYSHFAMRGTKDLAKEAGVSVRKFKFKDAKDLVKKLSTMVNGIFDVAYAYCGGPDTDVDEFIAHNRGTINTDIKTAYEENKNKLK
jgi:hypothetical protein